MFYNPFKYDEKADLRYLKFIRPELFLDRNTSNEALFIRLLAGTLRCTNLINSDDFDQLDNYFILGRYPNVAITPRVIKSTLEPDIDFSKLCDFLKDTKDLNEDFFEHLLIEVTSFFYKKIKGNHTTAFLHLYRTLEYISYSFPLIFASRSRDYYGTFEELKDYFDTSRSELTFFDSFVNKLFDSTLLESPVTFSFNSLIPQINSNHYFIFKKCLKGATITSDVRNRSITTNYDALLKLTVKIRNTYFHFAVGGQRNIKGSDILESDIFFSIINDELLNWISVIYYEILKTFCA